MVVLNADRKTWLIRLAAHNVVNREEREAAKPRKGGQGG